MTLSDSRRITDEMLSAYIDDQVTEQERAWIEAAIAHDAQLAWRLDSLRQTVTLLRELPEVALPRTFTLSLDQARAAQPAVTPVPEPAAPARRAAATTRGTEGSVWARLAEGLRGFWQGGSPMLRNAAAVSFALLILITSGGPIISQVITQPGAAMRAESAPAAAAPAAVALAPTATPAQAVTSAGGEAASQPVQEGAAANKAPPTNARVMQASPESDTQESGTEESGTQESAALESAAPEPSTTGAPAAAQAGESASEAAPSEEPAAAAVMAAPAAADAAPPLEASPFPFAGPADGRGGAGGAGDTEGLLPEEAYTFDVDPLAQPTPLPAEEAVSASVAAAPAADEEGEAVAAMEGTPAVDAPVAAAASMAAVAEPAEAQPAAEAAETPVEAAASDMGSDTGESAAARSAAPAAAPEQPTGQGFAPTTLPAGEPVTASAAEITGGEAASEAAVIAPTVAAEATPIAETPGTEAPATAVPATVAPTAEAPTAEAVAVVPPAPVTSSQVIENVPADDATLTTGAENNLPVLWIAQGSMLLLTIALASLWWRSREPRG